MTLLSLFFIVAGVLTGVLIAADNRHQPQHRQIIDITWPVTTFSLNIMVSAYHAASSNVTRRALTERLDNPLPGAFVHPGTPALWLESAAPDSDPGTAIAVTGHGVRLLLIWRSEADRADAGHSLRLYMKASEPEDFFNDLFTGIARDGAGLTEVPICLQTALRALARINPQAFSLAAKKRLRQNLTENV